jgi:hypothetical protein
MLENKDYRVVNRDIDGKYHFNSAFENSSFLKETLNGIRTDYPSASESVSREIVNAYEKVFNHRAFTGRSGTMFGYEGLGCIYWHMVSKLLLAVQENYQASVQYDPESSETAKLAELYYRVREGIGFNKTPEEYGAFPTDPYSHTPKHAGAQQPGMTGQVKEEIITRFGELGVRVEKGKIRLSPTLLDKEEFICLPARFRFENVFGDSQIKMVPQGGLAFTYCQVPFIYSLSDKDDEMKMVVTSSDGDKLEITGDTLPADVSKGIFERNGATQEVLVLLPKRS